MLQSVGMDQVDDDMAWMLLRVLMMCGERSQCFDKKLMTNIFSLMMVSVPW